MSTIVLITPPAQIERDTFYASLRDVGPKLVAVGGGGAVRLLLADVDQSPLLGNGVNETLPNAFAAALVCEQGSDDSALAALLAPLGGCRSYRVDYRRILGGAHEGAAGARTKGFAMVSPVHRSPKMSHDEFDAHWRDNHAPLARKHHVGMWRYHQCPIAAVLTDGADSFDGIAFLYFESVEDYTERLFDDDAGRRIIMDDTKRFLDLARSEAVLMSETLLRSAL